MRSYESVVCIAYQQGIQRVCGDPDATISIKLLALPQVASAHKCLRVLTFISQQ